MDCAKSFIKLLCSNLQIVKTGVVDLKGKETVVQKNVGILAVCYYYFTCAYSHLSLPVVDVILLLMATIGWHPIQWPVIHIYKDIGNFCIKGSDWIGLDLM